MSKAPDWKKASDYPDEAESKSISPDRWAWEFLRRNKKFQAELEKAKKRQATYLKENAENPIGWSKTPVGLIFCKWGVEHPNITAWIDARAVDTPVAFEKYPKFLRFSAINGVDVSVARHDSTKLCLQFDLSSPIEPQIQRAKATLMSNQKAIESTLTRRRNNERFERFPCYLRILDAIDAGAKNKEIADCLFLADDTLAMAKKKAEALRDGGYKTIAEKPKR